MEDIKKRSYELYRTIDTPNANTRNKAEMLRMYTFASNYINYLGDRIQLIGNNEVVYPDVAAFVDARKIPELLKTKITPEIEEQDSEMRRRIVNDI
jgi:hypothetical protein